jgi:hypothetical protein
MPLKKPSKNPIIFIGEKNKTVVMMLFNNKRSTKKKYSEK